MRPSDINIQDMLSLIHENSLFTTEMKVLLNFSYPRGEEISVQNFMHELFIYRDHDDLIQNSDRYS